MSTINVSSAQARRLLFVRDQWTLEIQRWQSLERDLFTPVLSYVTGADSVLRYLNELDESNHLLAQAERLLGHPGNPDTLYEAREGHWVAQTSSLELPAFKPESPPPMSEMNQVMAHLTALEERLERMELRLQGRIADNDAPTPSVRPFTDTTEPTHKSSDDEAKPVSQAG